MASLKYQGVRIASLRVVGCFANNLILELIQSHIMIIPLVMPYSDLVLVFTFSIRGFASSEITS